MNFCLRLFALLLARITQGPLVLSLTGLEMALWDGVNINTSFLFSEFSEDLLFYGGIAPQLNLYAHQSLGKVIVESTVRNIELSGW